MPSAQVIEEKYDKIVGLDVDNCRASRPEDEIYVKQKIEKYSTIDRFNKELQKLVAGIAFPWMHIKSESLKSQNNDLIRENERLQREVHELQSRLSTAVAPEQDVILEERPAHGGNQEEARETNSGCSIS